MASSHRKGEKTTASQDGAGKSCTDNGTGHPRNRGNREITTISRGAAAEARQLKIVVPRIEEGLPGQTLAGRRRLDTRRCQLRTEHYGIARGGGGPEFSAH